MKKYEKCESLSWAVVLFFHQVFPPLFKKDQSLLHIIVALVFLKKTRFPPFFISHTNLFTLNR